MGNPPSSPGSPAPSPAPGPRGGSHVFQAPTGTRDFYPSDLNKLHYIQEAWRRTSINHGFDEIDGPAFEHLDLYTVKSGEGIISELFSFERFGGEKTFALRPEFTPTLARMYAAKAASLPKPTKWFWQQNCYRAERPQRGRLREFSQWNCDIIGDDSPAADAEVIACCVGALESIGVGPRDARVHFGHRGYVEEVLREYDVSPEHFAKAFSLLDGAKKTSFDDFARMFASLYVDRQKAERLYRACTQPFTTASLGDVLRVNFERMMLPDLRPFMKEIERCGLEDWLVFDFSIARGLAYYTGLVFEVIASGERAIAGGGRYDKLIEMFGGPPTPAVGFGMGDVVLSLVLQDKGLMPPEEKIAESLGLCPDALVISNGTPEADGAVAGVVATLRRAGLHARRSYKTTKNIGKLIQDAAKARARFCVILESATTAQVKNMRTQGQEPCGIAEIAARIARSPQV